VEYYAPKCNANDSLVKSRCECKKTIRIKIKKKAKRLTIKVKKKKPKKSAKKKTKKAVKKKPTVKKRKPTKAAKKKKAKKKTTVKCDASKRKICKSKKKVCNSLTGRCKNASPKKNKRKAKSIKRKLVIKTKRVATLKNTTPKLAKELRGQHKKRSVFSPTINRRLATLKSLSPKTDVYGCPDEKVMVKGKKGQGTCKSWRAKAAQDVMLDNLLSKKPIVASNIIAPKQLLSNCWMNSFFVTWFLSDSGRKFNRWFRQCMITGTVPTRVGDKIIQEKIPSKYRKPAFLLNKMIDAALRGGPNEPSRYATLMDTNDVIRGFRKSAGKAVVKTRQASNPLTFYKTIYHKMFKYQPMPWCVHEVHDYGPGKITWNSVIKDIPNTARWRLCSERRGIPSVLFIGIFENEAKLKKKRKIKIKTMDTDVEYTLDAAVLRDLKQVHFSAYVTINGKDYGFDGESYSRLTKFQWKNKLNKDMQWNFAEQYPDTLFNFTKGYQLLMYYRTK